MRKWSDKEGVVFGLEGLKGSPPPAVSGEAGGSKAQVLEADKKKYKILYHKKKFLNFLLTKMLEAFTLQMISLTTAEGRWDRHRKISSCFERLHKGKW
jgi:hypothetical protein